MDPLFEDLTETVPPTTELSSGFQNIPGKLFKLGSEFIDCGVIGHLRVIVRRSHLNERGFLSSDPEYLIGSECTNDHLGNSIEDSAFPIVVIGSHFFSTLVVGFNCALLNTFKVHITNVLVVFDKLSKDLGSVRIEEF